MCDPASAGSRTAGDPLCSGEEPSGSTFHQYQGVAAVVLEISLVSLFLRPLLGPRSIALIYVLGTVIAALFAGRGATLFAAAMSALFWDFCFLDPIGKLGVDNVASAFMLGTFLVLALVAGQLTRIIRARQIGERLRKTHSTALYRLAGKLAEATDLDEALRNAVQQTEASFAAHIALLLLNSKGELSYHAHSASTYDIAGPEQPVADWVFANGQAAGQFTDKLAHVDTLFVPLAANGRTLGVMGLSFRDLPALGREQRELLRAFCDHIARALARYHSGTESEPTLGCWLEDMGPVRNYPP